MIQINDLPQEILEYILYFVSPYDDLKSCRLVSKQGFKIPFHIPKLKNHNIKDRRYINGSNSQLISQH